MTERQGIGAVAFSTATLYEAAGGTGALPSAIKPIHPHFTVSGPALPVVTPPSDNLWIHRAIAEASPGDVLVVSTGQMFQAGYWGEILSTAAVARGLGGVVLDACARDAAELAKVGFPVFARGLCIEGTTKDLRGVGAVGQPVPVGGVVVERGDLVVGDLDGVVVVAHDRVDAVLEAAARRERDEQVILQRLQDGATTVDIFGLG